MKMVLDDAGGLNLIGACEGGKVRIRGQHHAMPLVVYPRELDPDWPVSSIDQLDGRALRAIASRKPEVLIIGTGRQQHFPHPRVLIPLMDAGIGYEVMDNRAACRTYNILLSEGRNAALALLGEGVD